MFNRGERVRTHGTLIVALLLMFLPFTWAVLNSFKTPIEIFSGQFLPTTWSFDNYIAAWTTGGFGQNFLNSVIVAGCSVVLELVIAVPAGYAFAKLWLKRFPALFYVFIVGMAIPIEAFVITLFFQLKEMGLVDDLWGVIWPTVATNLPFAVFLMRNAFRDLPDSFLESAQLDGAGTVRAFWSVMVPLARPAVLVIAVLGFLEAWNEFFVSILVLISPESRTIPMGIFTFVDENGSNYGAIFAATVLSLIPSAIVYVIFQRSFISGLATGGIKE